jgi:hypothetical protein
MWHTSSGDRVIKGAEAIIIKSAITGMVEIIREESSGYGEQWDYGIRLFDELDWPQRLALLDQVATYLLTETRDTLELTAVNEAAVGAIFEHIMVEVSWEIDINKDRDLIDEKQPRTQWRQMVLNVCAQALVEEVDGELGLPDLHSEDHQEWHEIVDILSDGILWDRDYEMGTEFFDSPPELSQLIKDHMGIDDDYYSTPAPDVKGGIPTEEIFEHIDSLTKG